MKLPTVAKPPKIKSPKNIRVKIIKVPENIG